MQILSRPAGFVKEQMETIGAYMETNNTWRVETNAADGDYLPHIIYILQSRPRLLPIVLSKSIICFNLYTSKRTKIVAESQIKINMYDKKTKMKRVVDYYSHFIHLREVVVMLIANIREV